MSKKAKIQIKFWRCLKIGVGLGIAGATGLAILETAYLLLFFAEQFNSAGEFFLFFLYLLGLLSFCGVIIGFGEGILSWILLKVSYKNARYRRIAFFWDYLPMNGFGTGSGPACTIPPRASFIWKF